MPTHSGKDGNKCYMQWGNHGKKYYYTCGDKSARNRATKKANAQGQAAHASGYVGNQQQGEVKMFQYIVTNLKPVVRHDSMEGRDWLVGPVQMITEGVHNGSDGPIFYPAEELAKMTAVWNHKPVVVYHPQRNGVGVSACDPAELTARKIGVLMNTAFNGETKKLGADAWLDPTRIDVVDNRVSKAIENNEIMEVSTGLFMDLEKSPGEWNGKEYIGIARNIQPDHLAVLPDLKGACSVADGAGLLRTNQAVNRLSAKVMNEMSFDSVQALLREALLANEDSAWIYDVFDDYFIYEKAGRLYKQLYKIDEGRARFEGLSTSVERQVTYKERFFQQLATLSANKTGSNLKGNKMDKEKIVNELIANEKTSWTEEHRTVLMALDEVVLTNMHTDLVELTKTPPVANKPDDKKPADPPIVNIQTVTPTPKVVTAKEYVENAPPEIRDYLQDGLATMNEKRQGFISVITANKQNTFTKEHLEKKDTRELQALAALAQTVTENQTIIPMYLGQNGASSGGKPIEPLVLPTMNFEKETKAS